MKKAATGYHHYDQLNRLVKMNAFKGLNTQTNSWTPIALDDYQESLSYDANGNILTYKRNGSAGKTAMDNMSYQYDAGTNRLNHVKDVVSKDNYNEDLDDQQAGNYKYDAIGNLISDSAENIKNIRWNVYGKIAAIEKKNGDVITYSYDAAGNRIGKTISPNGKGKSEVFYVRDASGNVMSTYVINDTLNAGKLSLSQAELYGSSRLGVEEFNLDVRQLSQATAESRAKKYGSKRFELTEHRGNVMAVISENKTQIDDNNDGLVDRYTAQVLTATDYSSYGATLPGRTFAGTGYRYGYNGKENDKDISSGAQDYGLRIYDTRLGKFLSVDPLSASYPFYSPYQFAGNTPIQFIDLDGGEPKSKTSTNAEVRKLLVLPFEGGYARRLSFIHGPYLSTGGNKEYFSKSETESKGYYENTVNAAKFFGYDRAVNTNSQFYYQDETYSEKQLINQLLGDFIWGNGPENIVFKHNGKYSNLMKESIAVGETLAKFSYDLEKGASQKTYSWANDLRGEVNINMSSGPLSLAHFVGSS